MDDKTMMMTTTEDSLHAINKLLLLEKPEEGKMRLFVRIQGLSPIQLHQHKGLLIDAYMEIVNQYYINLYSGKPPGPLYPHKIIHFPNGDKLLEYRRKESLALKFCMEVQNKTPIYDEPPPCKESIVMGPSPAPDLCEHQVPKIISLNRLFLKMTDPWSDGFLLKVFWCTFRNFTKPRIVLNKLIERFDVPPLGSLGTHSDRSISDTFSDEDPALAFIDEMYFNIEIKRKIQERVGQILLEWVENSYFDFDDKMIQQLENFCVTRLGHSGFVGLSERILECMKTTPRTPHWQRVAPQIDLKITRTRKMSSMIGADNLTLNIMQVSDQEVAETLTFMDHMRYNQIKFTEMLEQAWNKDKKRHMAPNIMNNINFLNKVSSWVAFTILAEDNIQQRKKIIKKFIRIMLLLKKLNSFNMLLAFNAGMNNAAVHRLSHTWVQVSEKITTLRNNVVEVISSTGNFKQLRETMNRLYERGEPCSPYLGIYLKDLVFTDDGNSTYVDGKINMYKFICTYNIMFQILRFQGRDYKFPTPNAAFIKEINSFKRVDDDTLFDMSLRTQPKEPRVQ